MLAGTSLAIAVENRRAKGDDGRAIDRYVLTRGAIILAFEIVWMSPVMLEPGRVLFQVLYAIGTALMCMAFLRRLSDRALALLGFGIVALGEAVVGVLHALHVDRTLPAALVFVPGSFFDRRCIVAYPMLPWLGIMLLGWVLGRRLVAWREVGEGDRAPKVLAIAGAISLAVYVVLRGVDGYGNMLLHRDSMDVVQWLHVSKSPPSITYTTLELGIAALLLAGLSVVTRTRPDFGGPLRLFGQVALFYYLLHVHLLTLAGWILGMRGKLGVKSCYVGAFGVLLVLYPACRWYQRYKAAHTRGWTRYV
jgi:uncharacterized membrane protein